MTRSRVLCSSCTDSFVIVSCMHVERQKLVRRINKLKKAQEEDDANIASDLYEARLLLNYVLVGTVPKDDPEHS